MSNVIYRKFAQYSFINTDFCDEWNVYFGGVPLLFSAGTLIIGTDVFS